MGHQVFLSGFAVNTNVRKWVMSSPTKVHSATGDSCSSQMVRSRHALPSTPSSFIAASSDWKMLSWGDRQGPTHGVRGGTTVALESDGFRWWSNAHKSKRGQERFKAPVRAELQKRLPVEEEQTDKNVPYLPAESSQVKQDTRIDSQSKQSLTTYQKKVTNLAYRRTKNEAQKVHFLSQRVHWKLIGFFLVKECLPGTDTWGHRQYTRNWYIPGHRQYTGNWYLVTDRTPGTGTYIPGHRQYTRNWYIPGHRQYTGNWYIPGHRQYTRNWYIPGHRQFAGNWYLVTDSTPKLVPGHRQYNGTGTYLVTDKSSGTGTWSQTEHRELVLTYLVTDNSPGNGTWSQTVPTPGNGT